MSGNNSAKEMQKSEGRSVKPCAMLIGTAVVSHWGSQKGRNAKLYAMVYRIAVVLH